MALVIEGCTNSDSDNYDALATVDDGSCYREGCTNSDSDNYDVLATVDNGSCYREGCMSDWADNYDALATLDDSSCYRNGCMYPAMNNYDSFATQDPYLLCNFNQDTLDFEVDLVIDSLTALHNADINILSSEIELLNTEIDSLNGMHLVQVNVLEEEISVLDDEVNILSNQLLTAQEQYQVIVSAYAGLQDQYDSLLINGVTFTNTGNDIVVDFELGWNMFGYCSTESRDIEEYMDDYSYKIELLKDVNGHVYWPGQGYNGIGSFIPGEGYLIKVNLPFSITFE